jgi:hypothetical protein
MLMHIVEKCLPIVKDGNVMKLVDRKKIMTLIILQILMHWKILWKTIILVQNYDLHSNVTCPLRQLIKNI